MKCWRFKTQKFGNGGTFGAIGRHALDINEVTAPFISREENTYRGKARFKGASQMVLVVKNPPASAGDVKNAGSTPGIPWRRAWQSVLVFLSGEFHGQK